jgi:hypothetical protein
MLNWIVNSTSSLKKNSAGRHVAPLDTLFWANPSLYLLLTDTYKRSNKYHPSLQTRLQMHWDSKIQNQIYSLCWRKVLVVKDIWLVDISPAIKLSWPHVKNSKCEMTERLIVTFVMTCNLLYAVADMGYQSFVSFAVHSRNELKMSSLKNKILIETLSNPQIYQTSDQWISM